jgi:hypothetical protein
MAKFIKGEFVLVPNREQALKLRGASLNVYLAICAHADKDGGCFPSYATIAEQVDYSVIVCKRAVETLLEIGLITRENRNRVNGAKTSNYYQIIIVSGGLVSSTIPPSIVHDTSLTKPINVPKGTAAKNDEELLKIVNTIAKRSFRTLPRGTKKLLDIFTLVEIEAALRAEVADPWHHDRIKELSLDYMIRPTTIDKFLGQAKPSNPNNTPEKRAQHDRYVDAMMKAFREGADRTEWEKEHSINDF